MKGAKWREKWMKVGQERMTKEDEREQSWKSGREKKVGKVEERKLEKWKRERKLEKWKREVGESKSYWE